MGESEGHAGVPARNEAEVSPLAKAASSASLQKSPALMRWRHRLLRRIFHVYFRLSRGMTLGVRAVVINPENEVFLVRHTYLPGWHLPGGGIEGGQCARDALEMELREEGHIRLEGQARLHGVFQNRECAPRDHVFVYIVRAFTQERARLPDREIAEAGFFPLDALPDATTPATLRRLREVIEGLPAPDYW